MRRWAGRLKMIGEAADYFEADPKEVGADPQPKVSPTK